MNDPFFQIILTNLHIMKKPFPYYHLLKETGRSSARSPVSYEKPYKNRHDFYIPPYSAINIQHTMNESLTHMSHILIHMLHKYAF